MPWGSELAKEADWQKKAAGECSNAMVIYLGVQSRAISSTLASLMFC